MTGTKREQLLNVLAPQLRTREINLQIRRRNKSLNTFGKQNEPLKVENVEDNEENDAKNKAGVERKIKQRQKRI